MRVKTSVILLLCLLACAGCGQKSTDQLIEDLNSPKERDRIIAVRLLPQREEDAAKVVPASPAQPNRVMTPAWPVCVPYGVLCTETPRRSGGASLRRAKAPSTASTR